MGEGTTIGVGQSTKDRGKALKTGQITWDQFMDVIFRVLPKPHQLSCEHCHRLVCTYGEMNETSAAAYRVEVEGELETLLFCDHECLLAFVEGSENDQREIAVTPG